MRNEKEIKAKKQKIRRKGVIVFKNLFLYIQRMVENMTFVLLIIKNKEKIRINFRKKKVINYQR